jgi:hypothetical protein
MVTRRVELGKSVLDPVRGVRREVRLVVQAAVLGVTRSALLARRH